MSRKESLLGNILGGSPAKTPEQKAAIVAPEPKEKSPSKVKGSAKTGRPAKIDEDVKKYSYYLTGKHYHALQKCAMYQDADYSTIVRDAIEEYSRKRNLW